MSIKNVPHRIRFFIHPLPLGAVLLMALNDHWLKYEFGNVITGKLSDFCGIFYFPIFLLALMITVDELFKIGHLHLSPKTSIAAIVFTDLLLILVKMSAPSARLIEKFFTDWLFPTQLIQDPTDLIALIVNPLTYFYLRSYWAGSKLT